MPAPPSYLDITSLPFAGTITQAQFNGGTYGGTVNMAWLRYVATEDLIIGCKVNQGGNFVPIFTLYRSDGSSVVVGNTGNESWWSYLEPDTYYIRVIAQSGGSTNFDFTVTVKEGPLASFPLPEGTVVINDDARAVGNDPHLGESYPATAWLLDGTFLGFIIGVPAGETSGALSDGTSLWHNRWTGTGTARLKLFDANYTLLSSFDLTPNLGAKLPSLTNDGEKFFVLDRNTWKVYEVSSAGVVNTTALATLPVQPAAIGVSRDGTILYWTDDHLSGDIKKWDLVNDADLGTLYSISAFSVPDFDYVGMTGNNEHPGDILVLIDGTIVTNWYDRSASESHLLHIAADGSLLHDYTYAHPVVVDHIHYSVDNPTHVVVWFFLDTSGFTGRLGVLELATGTLNPSFDTALFDEGEAKGATLDDGLWGPSSSCSMMTNGYPDTTEPPEEEEPPGPSPNGGNNTNPSCCDNPCSCDDGGPNDNPSSGGGGPTCEEPPPVGDYPSPFLTCTGGYIPPGVADLPAPEYWG